MGIDELTKPQLIRWAIKSDDLASDAKIVNRFDQSMGTITGGSRNTSNSSLLKWELIMPLAKPEVEIIPFMLDWSRSDTHPTQKLLDENCELLELYATHPKPRIYSEVMQNLSINIKVEQGKKITLKAIIRSPNGLVEI